MKLRATSMPPSRYKAAMTASKASDTTLGRGAAAAALLAAAQAQVLAQIDLLRELEQCDPR